MPRGCCSSTATRRRSPRTSTSRTIVCSRASASTSSHPNTRGFSGLDGTPTEETLAVDARAAYDYLRGRAHVPASRIVAVRLVAGFSRRRAAGLRGRTGRGHPRGRPGLNRRHRPAAISVLSHSPGDAEQVRFLSSESIGSGAPILFLHSPEDEVIPIWRRAAAVRRGTCGEALRGSTGRPCLRELCGRTARFVATISAFLQQHGLGAGAPAPR